MTNQRFNIGDLYANSSADFHFLLVCSHIDSPTLWYVVPFEFSQVAGDSDVHAVSADGSLDGMIRVDLGEWLDQSHLNTLECVGKIAPEVVKLVAIRVLERVQGKRGLLDGDEESRPEYVGHIEKLRVEIRRAWSEVVYPKVFLPHGTVLGQSLKEDFVGLAADNSSNVPADAWSFSWRFDDRSFTLRLDTRDVSAEESDKLGRRQLRLYVNPKLEEAELLLASADFGQEFNCHLQNGRWLIPAKEFLLLCGSPPQFVPLLIVDGAVVTGKVFHTQ